MSGHRLLRTNLHEHEDVLPGTIRLLTTIKSLNSYENSLRVAAAWRGQDAANLESRPKQICEDGRFLYLCSDFAPSSTIARVSKSFFSVLASRYLLFTMPGIKQFLHGQILESVALPTASLAGRTIVITGANSGLGLEAAKHLLRLNASHIILACRTVDKAEGAKKEVLKSAPAGSKSASTEISCYALQMDDFSSLSAFAEKLSSSIPRLDAAILNAGVDLHDFTTSSGYETTLTINVLSTFTLAMLLLPKLRESATQYNILPRIAIVGSAVQFWANPKSLSSIPTSESIFKKLSDEDWSVAQGNAPMKGEARYFLSKLLVMLCVVQLAQTISEGEKEGKPLIVVNNVAPGYCITSLFREDENFGVKMSLKAIGRPADVGARTLIHGGCEAGKESHGQYLSECKVKKMAAWCQSKEGVEVGKRVWKEVVATAESVKPGAGTV